MVRKPRSMCISRRDAIRFLTAGAGFSLVTALRDNSALALGQPGGWHAAASPRKPTFPKGSLIRTVVKDMPPE